jgi:hypothetical protein
MKKHFFILMAFLPIALTAQVAAPVSVHYLNPTLAPKQTSSSLIATFPGTSQKVELSELLDKYATEDSRYNFFEVGEEMFKAFCELENADSTSIALFKKIKSVKMLEQRRTEEEMADLEGAEPDAVTLDPTFYQEITSQLDLTGYNQLLKSRNNRSMALLVKKEFGPADNEFLLITDRMVIDIRGDIMIKTIYQMEEMMGYVQQILPN